MSTLKHLVSEKLNIPVRQQRLLFKGKALADGKRLSDYSIGQNSKLNLVVKPLEKVLLEESTARKTAEAPAPPPAAWPLISRVLARHFSAADASRVLDQLQRVRIVARDLYVLLTSLCPRAPPPPAQSHP